jgi:glycerol uptake facilitator-like aquaporin
LGRHVLAAVVGSGIMAQRLADGNVALALLRNTIPTGAILAVLILIFGPLSGAHFNPAVSVAFALRDTGMPASGLVGVWAVHLMFELPVWQISTTPRAGPGQRFCGSHCFVRLASHDLRLCGARACRRAVCAVGLYITLGLLATTSTSFANPAVRVARAFAGVPALIAAQFVGTLTPAISLDVSR